MRSSESPRLTPRADEAQLQYAQELAEIVYQRNNQVAKKGVLVEETEKLDKGFLEGDPRTIDMARKGSHKKEAPSYGEQDGAMDMKLRKLRTNTGGQRNSNVQGLMKMVDHNRRIYQEQPIGQERVLAEL
jgi:hypothetical protein